MAVDFTHVGLLASVRRLAAAPTATAAGSLDADILAHVNEVQQSELAPFVLQLREEYFLQLKSQTVTVGTGNYRIPSRAIGSILRDVAMKDGAGNYRSLSRTTFDELEEHNTSSNGIPTAFYMRGGNVVIVPAPSSTNETLEIPYFIRPSQIVQTAYGVITAINTSSKLVSFTPTGTFTPSTSAVLDLVASSSGFESLAIDQTPSAAVSGVSVTLSSLPTDLVVGDYVCTSEQTPVPQLPAEFHPLLYVLGALRLAESLGNQSRIGYLSSKVGGMREEIRKTYSPRVQGEPKIISPGPYGLLSGWSAWGVD